MTNEQTKPAPRFKEKVIKQGLTHEGRPRAEGETIEVTEPQREYLRKKGFIADSAKAAPADAKKKD